MAAGNTYEAIFTETLASAQASVTFSSIPSTYTDLVIVINGGQATANNYYGIRFNGDTTTNYSNTQVVGNGSTATSNRNLNQNVGYIHSTNESSIADTVMVNVFDYANTTTYKTSISRGNSVNYRAVASVILWRKTPEAINSISILGVGVNLLSGSTFTLYGIKSA
jgi:hypothetical protein